MPKNSSNDNSPLFTIKSSKVNKRIEKKKTKEKIALEKGKNNEPPTMIIANMDLEVVYSGEIKPKL